MNCYFLKKICAIIQLGDKVKCVYCNKVFYIKRSLLELFSTKKEYICNTCYKKYPIDIRMEKIRLDIYDCTIISLFSEKYYIDKNYYIREYSKVFNAFYKKENNELLFFDEIDLDDNGLALLDGISKLLKSNLIILVFNVK